jgi:thioesterase domain-containing protein
VVHPTLGEDIVAAVALRPGAKAVASEVRSFVAERLSRSKVPGRIWFVESIPLSASGKPLREALRTRFQANNGPQESAESFAAGDESAASLRQQIGSIWVRVVGSDFPRPDDNFFAMGGDSLSAARLFALLQTELELDDAPLDIAKFLDSPTFFQLVQTVAQRAPAETRFQDVSSFCLQSLGAGPPIFFFPGEAMEPWSLRHLARELGEEQPFFALRHQLGDAADFPDIANRFVALLSQICPAGPILLAGHCYGGILAYDVAQRMIAMSRSEVAVVLVEVETPGYPKARVSRYLQYLPNAFRAVLRGEGRRLGIELAGHFGFIRALRNRTRKLDRDLPACADAPTGLTPCGIVLRTYEPQPFPGFLGNALALGREVSERVLEDSRKGWRDLARGPFEESSFLGTHTSIFDAQNSPALASFLGSALNSLKIVGRS